MHYVLMCVIKMVAEDGSNGAWCGDTESRCSALFVSSFRESTEQKAWEAQEIRRFVIFVAALVFLITNDKMHLKALLQALHLIRFWYCFQQIKSLHYHFIPFQNRFIIQT